MVLALSSVDLSRLIMATAKRDAAAFEQLYAGSCAKVYGVVLRILRRHDMAADIMEESYVQIWQDAEQFNPSQVSPMAWLVAIARRRAIDRARDPDIATSEAEPEIADAESPGALPRREMTEALKRLLTCIGRLEPDPCGLLLVGGRVERAGGSGHGTAAGWGGGARPAPPPPPPPFAPQVAPPPPVAPSSAPLSASSFSAPIAPPAPEPSLEFEPE